MAMMTAIHGTTDVADVLKSLGVDVVRVGDTEISARCPVHLNRTGKADRSPSWSMNASNGLWICYSCGAKGTLSHLVSELTGETDSIVAVHEFLIHNGLTRLTNPVEQEPQQPVVDWMAFSKFSVPSDELLASRNLDREAVRKYGIRWDTSTRAWVIPIVSSFGELLGWQSKSKTRVLNYPVGVSKSSTLFGLDKADCDTCVLVESPLDVVRLHTAMSGCCGLASFGAHISKTQISLLANHVNKLIIALDNDSAGIAAAQKLRQKLPAFRTPVLWAKYSHTDAKDIGDMTDAEVYESISKASVFPWWLHV
jgi:hypothetical protein